ncbi:hypothetical protein JTB14_003795 [Gonioctena quinquepunctata]|nr:hypothetical protein JTB14_003795 [Gonioctena quinquepunctata]
MFIRVLALLLHSVLYGLVPEPKPLLSTLQGVLGEIRQLINNSQIIELFNHMHYKKFAIPYFIKTHYRDYPMISSSREEKKSWNFFIKGRMEANSGSSWQYSHYSQPQENPNTGTVHQQPRKMGPYPSSMACPHCNAQMLTDVVSEPTLKTHIFAVILLAIGCCCFPYCVHTCRREHHFCSTCKAYLGKFDY